MIKTVVSTTKLKVTCLSAPGQGWDPEDEVRLVLELICVSGGSSAASSRPVPLKWKQGNANQISLNRGLMSFQSEAAKRLAEPLLLLACRGFPLFQKKLAPLVGPPMLITFPLQVFVWP